MNIDDFLLLSECALLGFGESDTAGAWIKLRITPEDLAKFRGRKGELMEVSLRVVDGMTGVPTDTSGDAEKDVPKKGNLAWQLHRNGFFYNPKLRDCIEQAGIYTQKQHKAWLETLPCYAKHNAKANFNELTGKIVLNSDLYDQLSSQCSFTGDSERRIVHHCRDAGNSGTGIKPPDWYGVPTCDTHHKVAHSSAVDEAFNDSMIGYSAGLTAHRMKEKMKEYLGLESLSDLTDDMLYRFEIDIGLQ